MQFTFTSVVIGFLCLSPQLLAIPMHTSIDTGVELPDHLNGYRLAVDHADQSVVYVSPRYGLVSTQGMQPEVGFAYITNDGERYGMMNIMFDFSIAAKDFADLKKAVHDAGKKIRPMPYVRTKMGLRVAGYEESKENGICADVQNPFDPEGTVTKCFNPIIHASYSTNGPKLGEKFFLSAYLSPAYAAAMPNLLASGAAFGVEMKADFLQAFPAYTAEIHVKWEKLKESFASFFAIHDGRCIDVEVSKHWEKELLCGQPMVNGERKNLNGRDCAIEIKLTDQHGKIVENVYAIEELGNVDDNSEYVTWVNNHATELKDFHQLIQDLIEKFEDEMFAKVDIRTAETSKEVTTLITYRSDYVKKEERREFTVIRKTLGRSIPISTVVPATLGCISVNPENGRVAPLLDSFCASYWNKEIDPKEIVPTSPGLVSGDRLGTQTALNWD